MPIGVGGFSIVEAIASHRLGRRFKLAANILDQHGCVRDQTLATSAPVTLGMDVPNSMPALNAALMVWS